MTPGTAAAPVIRPEEVVMGVDPPRFDQMISQGMDVFEEVAGIIEENKEGIEAAVSALSELGKVTKDILEKLSPEDIRTLRRILHRVDRITADLEVVMRDLRPTLAEARGLLREAGPLVESANGIVQDLKPILEDVDKLMKDAGPMVARANRLMRDLDRMAQQLRDLPEERKEEIGDILDRMTDTVARLQEIWRLTMGLLRQQVPPEIALVTALLEAKDAEEARQVLDANRQLIGEPFLMLLERIAQQLRDSGEEEAARRAETALGIARSVAPPEAKPQQDQKKRPGGLEIARR